MRQPLFLDRRDAGRQLAKLLQHYAHGDEPLVLGLPRGGVPVAFEVARALDAELDVFMVRKLGVPGQEELAMGAIASGDIVAWNEDVLAAMRVAREDMAATLARERAELARRARAYRGERASPRIEGRTVVLVDDGLATGASMRAAARALRERNPRELVIAVPVAAAETSRDLRREADELVCAAQPDPFYAVGLWYQDCSATADEEVSKLLRDYNRIRSKSHG